MGLDIRAADQVDAIGHRGKHAIQRLFDRFRLAGQIQNQRLLSDDADLARQDCSRHVLEADLAHLLAEPGHDLIGDGEGRFRRHIARRRPGAAGRQHEMAAVHVDELAQRLLDHRCSSGISRVTIFHGVARRSSEPFLEGGQALVFVNAARRAVADRNEADQKFVSHGVIISSGVKDEA